VRKTPDAAGQRRRTVSTPAGKRTLVFGHEPVFLSCETLPPEIAGDEHLLATPVQAVDPGTPVIDLDLKSERVQEPEAAEPGEPATRIADTALSLSDVLRKVAPDLKASRAAAAKKPTKPAPKKS